MSKIPVITGLEKKYEKKKTGRLRKKKIRPEVLVKKKKKNCTARATRGVEQDPGKSQYEKKKITPSTEGS